MRKRRKARYDAYRDIRRSAADERRQAQRKVSLGGALAPIFNHDKKQDVVGKLTEIMLDWRGSPFEHEGASLAGLRSQLCLQGYAWPRSDNQAREVVSHALRLIGAKRPSYDQGQREFVERDGACLWCGGEIDASDSAYGRAGKFCSVKCAESIRAFRAEEWDQRSSAVNRAAAATIARAKLEPVPCLHCGTMFKPHDMDARGRKFCSHKCVGDNQRVLPERNCDHCSKKFQPMDRRVRYCSVACGGKARRTLHARLCENPACAIQFRPRKPDQKFCCSPCVDAVGRPALFPGECLWCQRPFMGKHSTSVFCGTSCKSMEYQHRSGLKRRKTISPPVFDYVFRMAA